MRCLAMVLIVLATPTWAWAHNVGVDCKLKDGKLEIEGYYDDDTAAVKAKVKIVDAADKVVAEGTTDDKGRCVLPAPRPGKYVVHLDAGAGHRAKRDLIVPGSTKGVEPDSIEATTDDGQTISEGPTREEVTRSRWWKAGLGVLIIGGVCGAFLLAAALRRNSKRESSFAV